jgi:hypothetical protein
MSIIPELGMFEKCGIRMSLKLGLEVREKVGRDGVRWTRRRAWVEVLSLSMFGKEAFDGAGRDIEDASDLSTAHASFTGSDDAFA